MKVSKNFMIYLLVIIVMFIGAISPLFSYASIVLAILIGLKLGEIAIKYPNCVHCKGILLLLVFQNFALGLGAHLNNNMESSLSLVTQIPFIIIAMEWIVLIVSKRRLISESKKHRRIFYILLVLILLSILIGRGKLQAMLINIRNLTVFFMSYEIALLNITSKENFLKFEKFSFKLGVIVLIVGIILLMGGYGLYEIIGVKEVYVAKGSPLLNNKLDDRFTTSLVSHNFNRMGSLFYEPVNLGYFFSALTISSFFSEWTFKRSKKNICFCLMLLGLVLSFGKGGYMVTIAAFGYVIMQRLFAFLRKKIGKKTLRNGLIGVVIIIVTCFSIYYYKNIGAAASPHFWGIIQTWKSVVSRPYGYGLGTGGNASLIYGSNNSWYASGGETQLMSFIYQIGFQGGLVFAICVVMTKLSSKLNLKKGDEVFIVLPFILLGMSLLQDNTFTPQCIVLFMFLQAGVKKAYCESNKGD